MSVYGPPNVYSVQIYAAAELDVETELVFEAPFTIVVKEIAVYTTGGPGSNLVINDLATGAQIAYYVNDLVTGAFMKVEPRNIVMPSPTLGPYGFIVTRSAGDYWSLYMSGWKLAGVAPFP